MGPGGPMLSFLYVMLYVNSYVESYEQQTIHFLDQALLVMSLPYSVGVLTSLTHNYENCEAVCYVPTTQGTDPTDPETRRCS